MADFGVCRHSSLMSYSLRRKGTEARLQRLSIEQQDVDDPFLILVPHDLSKCHKIGPDAWLQSVCIGAQILNSPSSAGLGS